MDREDRERLVRIETLLTESVVPRLNAHGKSIELLEKVAIVASVLWSGACVVGWVAKDAAAAWLKQKVLGHQ